MFAHFKEYHGNHKNFKCLYGFGGRCLTIRDVCMDFEPYFKVHNLVSVHPKSIKLGQTTSLISFTLWYPFIDLLKFETRPSFLLHFGMANSGTRVRILLRTRSFCVESLTLGCLNLPVIITEKRDTKNAVNLDPP